MRIAAARAPPPPAPGHQPLDLHCAIATSHPLCAVATSRPFRAAATSRPFYAATFPIPIIDLERPPPTPPPVYPHPQCDSVFPHPRFPRHHSFPILCRRLTRPPAVRSDRPPRRVGAPPLDIRSGNNNGREGNDRVAAVAITNTPTSPQARPRAYCKW
jgi:hypothetical protein